MRNNATIKTELRSDEKEAIDKLRAEIGRDYSKRGFYHKLIMHGYGNIMNKLIGKDLKEKEDLLNKLLGGFKQ